MGGLANDGGLRSKDSLDWEGIGHNLDLLGSFGRDVQAGLMDGLLDHDLGGLGTLDLGLLDCGFGHGGLGLDSFIFNFSR